MKHTKEVPITQTVVDSITCDLCGTSYEGRNWGSSGFEHNDTELSCATGDCYPEIDCRKRIEVDICPNCFLNKLVPWLKSQGVNVEAEDVG